MSKREKKRRGRKKRGENVGGVRSEGSPILSLCMIVKNEEEYLPQCLNSVKSIVDEMVIVDTGSMDNTVEIAKSFKAKVIHHPWNNDFADVRNVSLKHATGEWVLVLDADEIIAGKDLPGIRKTCLSGRFNAYTLITRNYTEDSRGSNWVPNDEAYREVKGLPGWFPSRKVRLFKNNKNVRFEGAVHELAEPSIKKMGWHIGLCDIPVHHFGRLKPDKQREKEVTYLKLGHKKIVADAQNPKAYYERGVQNAELGLHAKAIEDFYAARKIAPLFPGIDSYLGASLTQLGRCDEAVAILNEGTKKEPENAGLWNNLGLVYYVKQDYDKAVKYLNKAICLNPKYAAAHKNLGMALSKKGKGADAAHAFQTALELNPSLVEIKGALEELEKITKSGEKQDKRACPRVMVLEAETGVIGEDCAEALNCLGCTTMRKTVKDKPCGPDAPSFDMSEMLRLIIDFKPDFILSINHKGLDTEGLISYACQELNIPVFIWYVDNPFSVTDWEHYDTPRNTIFLVFDSILAARLNEIREDFVYYLSLGTNPNRFKPVSLSHEDKNRYECDISFVGNLDLNKADMLRNVLRKSWNNIPPVMWDIMDSVISRVAKEPELNFVAAIEEEMKKNGGITYPGKEAKRLFEICVEFESSAVYRADIIKKIIRTDRRTHGLKGNSYNIKIFGKEEWRDIVDAENVMGQVAYRENLSKVYNASKINLNISRIQLRSALNQRVYDIPACRGFLITDFKKELEDSFDIGREIICYRHVDELFQLIDYYLKNPQERQKIADAGFKRVINEHTYHHRMKRLLEIYREKFAVFPAKKDISPAKKAQIYDLLGRGCLMSGKNNRAISWFTGALKIASSSADQSENLGYTPLLYYHMGKCRQNMGETGSARMAFGMASKLTPDHRIDIQLALCLSYVLQGDIDSCLHHCEIILKQLHLNCDIRLDSLKDLSELFSQIGLDLEKRRLFSEAMLARNTSAHLKSIIPD